MGYAKLEVVEICRLEEHLLPAGADSEVLGLSHVQIDYLTTEQASFAVGDELHQADCSTLASLVWEMEEATVTHDAEVDIFVCVVGSLKE